MIKKIVLLVLVLILIPMTYLLYRQMEELRPIDQLRPVVEAEHAEQALDSQKMMRQWTPPQKSIQGPVVHPDSSLIGDAGNTTGATALQADRQTAPESDRPGYGQQPGSTDEGRNTAPSTDSADATYSAETSGNASDASKNEKFTDREVIAPQQEVTELMSAIQARALKNETDPNVNLRALESQESMFPKPESLPKGINTLITMHVVPQGDTVLVQVVSRGPIDSYKYFFLGSPSRLAVDLLGKYDRSVPERDVKDNMFIKDIRTGRHPDKLRIVADLKSTAKLRLTVDKPQSNVLVLQLTKQ